MLKMTVKHLTQVFRFSIFIFFLPSPGLFAQVASFPDGQSYMITDPAFLDRFGYYNDISEGGERVVGRDKSCRNPGDQFNQAYVMQRDATNQYVAVGDVFDLMIGCGDVALSSDGKTVAFGGSVLEETFDPNFPGDLDQGDAGQVVIFEEVNGEWVLKGKPIAGKDAGERFGYHSVDLSADGNILAVAAHRANSDFSGDARVYRFDGNLKEWVQQGSDISGISGNSFLRRVSISTDGKVLAVGEDFIGYGYSRVFAFDGLHWVQRGRTFKGNFEGGESNIDVNNDGTTIIVGEIFNSDAQFQGGELTVYDWTNGAWERRGQSVYGGDHGRIGFAEISDDGNRFLYREQYVFNPSTSSNVNLYSVMEWDGVRWSNIHVEGSATMQNEPDFSWGFSFSPDGSALTYFDVLPQANEDFLKVLTTTGSKSQALNLDVKIAPYDAACSSTEDRLIEVAIYGSPDFDFSTINFPSLDLGGLRILGNGLSDGSCRLEFVNDDEQLDAVCLFSSRGISTNLVGETFDGGIVSGEASLCLSSQSSENPRGRGDEDRAKEKRKKGKGNDRDDDDDDDDDDDRDD